MTSTIITIGVLLSSFSSLPYIREIIRGTARPRIASWGVWTLLSGVMTVAAFADGQIPSALLSLVSFLGCAVILSLGWRQGSRELSTLDIICLVGAAVGFVALFVLRDPTAAVLVSVSVDAVAFIPTLVHGWESPEEESLACFSFATAGAVCALTAALLSNAALSGLAYPAYAVVFNGAMTAVLYATRATSSYRSDEVYE